MLHDRSTPLPGPAGAGWQSRVVRGHAGAVCKEKERLNAAIENAIQLPGSGKQAKKNTGGLGESETGKSGQMLWRTVCTQALLVTIALSYAAKWLRGK